MLHFLLVICVASTTAEVLTISSKEKITCVVHGDDADSAVYISPLIQTRFDKKLTEIDGWIADNWTIQNSLDSNLNAVTDKRWQDFANLAEGVGHHLKESRALPFSVCTHQNVVFEVMRKDFQEERRLIFTLQNITNGECNWFHYSLKKINQSLLLYSEDTLLQTYNLSFDPHWIYFKNSKFWRLHDYKFREAVAPTFAEKEKSIISVNFTNNLCVSMYVSIDKNSLLEISLSTKERGINNFENVTVLGFNGNDLRTWKRIEITAQNSGLGQLTFLRSVVEPGATTGYWAIDKIRFCDKPTGVYPVSLENGSHGHYTCKLLKELNQESRQILSCNKPGFLGKNCSISCEDVLGSDHVYCQRHKICQDTSSCFCSWGYYGDYCDQKCESGRWDMFCKSKCNSECPTCHESTGECLTPVGTMSNYSELQSIPTNLSDNVLPSEVTLKSNKMYLKFPPVQTKINVSYTLKYKCLNKWCENRYKIGETILVNASLVELQPFEDITPFTDYEVVVNAQRFNETVEKTYTVLRRDPFLYLKNLTIYSSDSSNLLVRFGLPNNITNLTVYKIWYYKEGAQSAPQYVTSLSRCETWSDFVCGKIGNLDSNSTYSVKIEREEKQGSKWLSNQLLGITCERGSQPPENLKILEASKHEAVIAWEYSSVTNGPLQEFVVNVTMEDEVNSYQIPANETQKSYKFKIPVEYDVDYLISVRADNKYEGNQNQISARFASIDSSFSSEKDVLLQICSPKCYWLIPRPTYLKNSRDFQLNVETKDEFEHKNSEIKPKEKRIFVLHINDYNEEYVRVNLEFDLHKAVLLTSHTQNALYLVGSSGLKHTIKTFGLSASTASLLPLTLIITIIFVVIIVSVLLLIILLHRKRTVKSNNSFYLIEQDRLIPGQECPDHFTKVELKSLESYLKQLLQNGKACFSQFRSLPPTHKPTSQALSEQNKNKNKDTHNIPYDHNRVILEKLDGMGSDDYINASYIDGLDRPKTYIATQGPKFSTVRDFWRMIWQEKIKTVVMATNFLEFGKRKCAEYLPQSVGATFECGEMFINFVDEEIYEHYHVRYLDIFYRKKVLKLRHFQLTWNPEKLNPLYANCIVPLIKRISSIRETSTTPILVHCSAGVIRTGTLILCDLALQMARTTQSVDFFSLLKYLRDQRPNMVSEKQYILAHLIVVECLMEEENVFKKSVSENFGYLIFINQLQRLKRLSWHDSIVKSWTPQHNETSSYISDYLCHTVDGYAKRRKYLTTKQPTGNTLYKFWKMVIQEDINIILLLCTPNFQMWPFHKVHYDTIFVIKELSSSEIAEDCTCTRLSVVVYQKSNHCVIFEKTVYLFQALNCELDINNTHVFISLFEEMNRNHHEDPMLIVCRDGISKCGMFVTLDYIIQKCKQEFEPDVCNGIRTVRRSGQQFVNTHVELEFLYKVLLEYLQKYDEYSSIL